MLKDEFCTREGSRCVILRGAVAALPLPRVGRCAPLVSTAALQPSFNGSLRLPSFIRGLRPLVSTQPYGCWLDSVVRYTDDFLRDILEK